MLDCNLVQCYITGEGRCETVHLYHMRFFLHLDDISPMNFTSFFLKRLTNMASREKNYPGSWQGIFHQALIKLLILQELKKLNHSWEEFIVNFEFISSYLVP